MGRFTFATVLVVGVWLMASGTAGAWPGTSDKDTEPALAAPDAAARESVANRERAERDKTMRDWQAKLSDSRWELEVVVSGAGRPAVVQSDVLTFKNGSVGSDVLAKADYERASFSLYPPTEQSIGWEAMQRKKEEKGAQETAIWRGEVTGETMQGTLVKQSKRGDEEATTQVFSFTGRRMATAPEPTPAAAQSEAPAAAPAHEVPAVAPKGSGSS